MEPGTWSLNGRRQNVIANFYGVHNTTRKEIYSNPEAARVSSSNTAAAVAIASWPFSCWPAALSDAHSHWLMRKPPRRVCKNKRKEKGNNNKKKKNTNKYVKARREGEKKRE